MNFNTPILVFDIETIPDLTTAKRLYPELGDLSDENAFTALITLREAETGKSFMQYPLHKIVCLSVLWVNLDKRQFKLRSLSLNEMDEQTILETFLKAIDKKPILVSWNGAGFDIPVLAYRSLHHRLSAPHLFNDHKNGYLNRYSTAHIDLMDKMKIGSFGNSQKLDVIASLCGFAGKGGVDGNQVLPMVQKGDWANLCRYCESDVVNTWLIYLRWQLLYGQLNEQDANAIEQDTLAYLATLTDSDGSPRHQAFLSHLANVKSPQITDQSEQLPNE